MDNIIFVYHKEGKIKVFSLDYLKSNDIRNI